MKFVCERCHTKYSIADEKVRGKVLKVRCKTCANVITVRETGATVDEGGAPEPREAAITRSGSFDAGDGATQVAPRPTRFHQARSLPVAALFAPGAPASAPPARARRSTPPPPPAEEVEWYLAVDGAQTGPFPRSRLLDKILSVPKGADVHVWNADLDGWKPPEEVADIQADLTRRRRVLTPVPPPLRRATGPGVALAFEGQGVAGSPAVSGGGGFAALEISAEVAKAPAPHGGGKRNGVNAGAGAAAAAAAAPSATVADSALGRFGLGDLLGDSGRSSSAVAPVGLSGPALSESLALSTAQPMAAPAAVGAGLSTAVATGTGRSKQLRLLLGAVAVVLLLCGIVSFWMLRRPGPTSGTGASSAPGKAAATDFAGMAEKLAREEANNGKTTDKPAEVPRAEGAPAPAATEQKPLIARIEPAPRVAKGKGRRNGRNQSGMTSPPPLGAGAVGNSGSAGLTAEQRDAASRFGESTGREVRVPTQMGASARSTPAQADISRVINNNRQGIQTCYQRALLRDNTLTHGKVTVRVSIGLSGKVKSVNLDAPAQFRALEPCIRDVMSRWAFPPSSEEYGTEFPVVLQGNQ